MRPAPLLLALLALPGGCGRLGFEPSGESGLPVGSTTTVAPLTGATDVVPVALAVTRDGGAVIAGSVDRGAGFDVAVVRLDAAGRLDPMFGADGVALIDLGSDEDLATGIAVGPDDAIVVVGEVLAGPGNDHDSAIARLTPDGALDATFAGGGIRVWPLSTEHTRDDRAGAVTIDAAGRVLVAGYRNTGYPDWEDVYVARLLPDGTEDPAFGAAGVVTSLGQLAGGGSSNDFPRFVGVAPDGRITVAATCGFAACAFRYGDDGAPDPTFGAAGAVTVGLGPAASMDEVFDAALLPDGGLLLAGSTAPDESPAARTAVVARLTPAGALAPGFGDAGRAAWDLAPGDDVARAIALEADGAILAGGTAHTGAQEALAIVRLSPAGVRDAAFGGVHVLHGAGATTRDLALDGRGRAHLLARVADQLAVIRRVAGAPWPAEPLPPAAALPYDAVNLGAADLALTDGQRVAGGAATAPLTAGRVTVTGLVRTDGAPALFLDAAAIAFADGAILAADGEDGALPGATPGAGGAGASGGGSGNVGYSGFAGFGGRFGRDGGSLGGWAGGRGFARAYTAGRFWGRGGDGARGEGCCPPVVPGGEAGNGGGGGGGGAWTNYNTAGGGGGGGLIVLVADAITGPGTVRARGGGGHDVNGAKPGGGGGGVVWIAARSYDGQLTADVSGGATEVKERGQAGTARIFQILDGGGLVERAFTDRW